MSRRGATGGKSRRFTRIPYLVPTVVVVLLLAVVLLTAWAVQPKGRGGELSFTPESIDVGSVPLGQPAPFSFKMRNVGDRPIRISKPTIAALEGC